MIKLKCPYCNHEFEDYCGETQEWTDNEKECQATGFFICPKCFKRFLIIN